MIDTKLIENTLHFVAHPRQYDSFFSEIVQYLGQALEVKHVLVGELLPDQQHLQTIAYFKHGSIVDNISYKLDGTPCQEIFEKQRCSHPRNVADLFPQYDLLRELEIESYAAVALWKNNGQPLGVLWLMDEKPLLNPYLAETLLQIVALRAMHQLEEYQAEAAIAYTSSFQSLITTLMLEFINLPFEKFDDAIQHVLQTMGEFVGASCCALNVGIEKQDRRSYEWHSASFAIPQHIDLKNEWGMLMEQSKARDSLVIPDTSLLPDKCEAVRQHLLAHNVGAMIAIPLYHKGQLIGFTLLQFKTPNSIPHLQDTVKLLQVVSETFVNVLDRKQSSKEIHYLTLAEEEQKRHRTFIESLLYTGSALSSTLQFDDLLDLIFDCVQRVVNYDSAMILRVREPEAMVEIIAHRGYPPTYIQQRQLPLARLHYIEHIIATREILFVPDTRSNPYFQTEGHYSEIVSFLGVPVLLDDQLIGILILGGFSEHFYQGINTQYLNIFAQQVGLAVRNAQFHEEALQVATFEERQRIARDLQDSVHQTLFSAATLAELVPRLIDKESDKAKQYSMQVEALASTAIAQIQTLLIELQPEVLAKTKLGILIRRLCNILAGSMKAVVTATISDQFILEEALQVVFYRIAQEAFNNIIKHAHATEIRVELYKDHQKVELYIQDNGHGFTQDQVSDHQLGLRTMKERAQSIEADLNIHSSTAGTSIRLKRRLS
jgi:signal transduction histidine kinase